MVALFDDVFFVKSILVAMFDDGFFVECILVATFDDGFLLKSYWLLCMTMVFFC
jgi:hypothetical protein